MNERENIKASYGINDYQLDMLLQIAEDFRANGFRVSVHDLLDIFSRPHVRFLSDPFKDGEERVKQ